MLKRANVHLINSDGKSDLWLGKATKQLHIATYGANADCKRLIVTQRKDVHKGDLCYTILGTLVVANEFCRAEVSGVQVVIAATNEFHGLPEPSPQFIEKFVTLYNAGEMIGPVMVEYIDQEIIRVDTRNFVTIKKIQSTWSRDDIEGLFNQFIRVFPLHRGVQILESDIKGFLDENL